MSDAMGIRLPPDSVPWDLTFKITARIDSVDENLTRAGYNSVSSFLMAGDTVTDFTGQPDNSWQFYFFIPDSSSNFKAHVRHNKRANFLFGDGHVQLLSKQQLVGNYPAAMAEEPSWHKPLMNNRRGGIDA